MYKSVKLRKNDDGSYAVIIDGVIMHAAVPYPEALAALENFLAMGGDDDGNA